MGCLGGDTGGRKNNFQICKNVVGKIIVQSQLEVIEFSHVSQFSHSAYSLAFISHDYMTALHGVLVG